jgi:hypothetical protein
MTDVTFRIEEVTADPKPGEPLRTRQRGTSYATLTEATRAAAGVGPRWVIIEERVVATSPEVEAIIQER